MIGNLKSQDIKQNACQIKTLQVCRVFKKYLK